MKYLKKLNTLIGFRGTKKQISIAISTRTTNKKVSLNKPEQTLKQNDIARQFSLGKHKDDYLDFDIYFLRTRAKENGKPVYLITEINSF